MVGCRFNMIGVSDRTSMGTRGECDGRRNAICRAELHRTAYRSSFAVYPKQTSLHVLPVQSAAKQLPTRLDLAYSTVVGNG